MTHWIAPLDPFGGPDPLGAGVAFADLDSDGDPDLIAVGRTDGVVGIYENLAGGFFAHRAATAGIPLIPDGSGVTAADYDGDGDLDLFFTSHFAPNLFLRNDGAFQFTDVTAEAGLGDAGPGMGSAWGDVNGDTWLDLFVANRTNLPIVTDPNRMYINNGDGTFTDAGESLGIDRANDPTLVAAFLDYDRDSDADLYLGNDKGTSPALQNHMFQNQGGGAFLDVTEATGTAANVHCMGIAAGDWTRNGWQDIYVTNIPVGNVLLLNQGDGTFLDFSHGAAVESFGIGWATLFLDYDNDGWEELYVCDSVVPNRFYDYDGSWPATDIGPQVAVADPSASFCAATADIDGDGDLDLAVMSAGQPLRLYVNQEGQARRWIRFAVSGDGHNRFAIGAQLDVRVGEVWQMREIFAGSNYKSQNEMIVHFGMGDALAADEVRVTWPGGASRTLEDLATNETWPILPPDVAGDCDGDGDVDLLDYTVFAACAASGDAAGSCACADGDDDEDVDLIDWSMFQVLLSWHPSLTASPPAFPTTSRAENADSGVDS